MINKIILTVFLLNSMIVSSQNILIWGQNNGNLPSNFLNTGQYYYKDVNNYLNNFIGTWEYVNGNEKFQIVLTKVTMFHVVIPNLELNYYKDGIVMIYKKYLNNNLIFESPTYSNPNFLTDDGIILKGYLQDYGRISKTLYFPFSSEVYVPGGQPISPHCWLTKQPDMAGQPPRIFFNLDLTGTVNYDKETYAGQPTFSIPNNVMMYKL